MLSEFASRGLIRQGRGRIILQDLGDRAPWPTAADSLTDSVPGGQEGRVSASASSVSVATVTSGRAK